MEGNTGVKRKLADVIPEAQSATQATQVAKKMRLSSPSGASKRVEATH